ncbi:MAG: nitroreductase family protein [Peptoniphilaceae bacterium]
MEINFSIEDAIRKRYSVRNYDGERIKKGKIEEIKNFINSLENPFGAKVNFHFLEGEELENKENLGTYGVIKGAKQYIGVTIDLSEDMALESLGYEFEILVLYLASMGIGTCWLGGTFNRKAFAKAMEIGEKEIFPIMSPYGYPAKKKHIKEKIMRGVIKADKRFSWDKLFYKDDFNKNLKRQDVKDLELALEMVRLGPSASNKQPWRIVIKDNICHFYEEQSPGYSSGVYDIQRIDLGIAAAHFDLTLKENNIRGHFEYKNNPELDSPKNYLYLFSWIRD